MLAHTHMAHIGSATATMSCHQLRRRRRRRRRRHRKLHSVRFGHMAPSRVSPRPPPPSPPPLPGPPASPLSLSDFTELQQELAILKSQLAALNHTVASVVVCSNSCHSQGCQGVGCSLAFDGVCDDGGIGAEHNLCDPGTDCGDCGPRPVAAGASLIQPCVTPDARGEGVVFVARV